MSDWLGEAASVAENVAGKALAGAAAGSAVPGIGTALGGLAGLASAVVPYVFGQATAPALAAAAAGITGATDEPSQVAALNSNSAAMLEFRAKALQIAQDDQQSRLDDTADARAQQLALVAGKSPLAWEGAIIDFIVLATFGFTLFWILKWGIPQDPLSHDVVLSFMSIIGTLAVQVVQYWRGSSSGSAVKGNKLETIAMSK